MTEPPRKSDKHGSHTNSHQKDPPSKLLPSEISPNLDAETPDEHSQKPKTVDNPSNRLPIADWIMVFATCVIAYATWTYKNIASDQWGAMDKQAKIMQGQLSTAKNTFEDARNSAIEQNARTERLTKANEKIAQASKQSVEIAKNVAQKSLDATIENFHLDQRAWIGPMAVSIPQYTEGDKKVYVKEGEKIKGEVVITNSGKTPAHNVRNYFSIQVLKPVYNPCDTIRIGEIYESTSVIQPGMTVYLNPHPFPKEGVISKTVVDDIANRNLFVYITGIITYEDIFNRPHFSKFCFRLKPDRDTFATCNTCNESN